MTQLKLNSVSILNAACIDTIGRVCQNLSGKCECILKIHDKPVSVLIHFPELSIRNFPKTDLLDESCMGHFKNLERLDLFRSNIELDVLLMVLKNNRKLKHLNLGRNRFPIPIKKLIRCNNFSIL